MPTCKIAPSLLSADFARLGEEVRAVIAAGADLIHFDVMDNHYVPNLTIGPLVCEAIKRHATVPIDVHLMVKPVDRIIPDFAKAGAALVSFHPEASEHIDRTIGLIRDCGCRAGLVFNPATPLDGLRKSSPRCRNAEQTRIGMPTPRSFSRLIRSTPFKKGILMSTIIRSNRPVVARVRDSRPSAAVVTSQKSPRASFKSNLIASSSSQTNTFFFPFFSITFFLCLIICC